MLLEGGDLALRIDSALKSLEAPNAKEIIVDVIGSGPGQLHRNPRAMRNRHGLSSKIVNRATTEPTPHSRAMHFHVLRGNA